MKKIIRISLILSIIFLLWTSITLADTNKSISDFVILEKSEEIKKWENLSEEQRKNTILPMYNSINLKQSIKRSHYNKLLESNEEIVKKYNITDTINLTEKNQHKTGSCWVFSYSSLLESTMAKKRNNLKVFSPMHIDYKTYDMFNRDLGLGGNTYLALAYSVSGNGPVYEEDLPFSSVYNETKYTTEPHLADPSTVSLNQTVKARVTEATFFAKIYKDVDESGNLIYTSDGTTQYSADEVKAIRNKIKKHISENGAVSATMHILEEKDTTQSINPYNSTIVENNQNLAYYYDYYYTNKKYSDGTDIMANHQVTIVGWDDEYSKTNFASGKQPKNDGAYIVLNSYGNSYGNNGYFYVAYDDPFIEEGIIGINDMQDYSTTDKSYDNLYQYDQLGANYNLYSKLSNMYTANVFKTKNNKTITEEYLSEIGLYLENASGIKIYVNTTDGNLINKKEVASYTGNNALEAGYHTIDITDEKIIGDKFAIIVEYIDLEGAAIPLECNLKDTGLMVESNYFDTAISNQGESYISLDGNEWVDMAGLSLTEDNSVVLRNTNACIKAFTVEQQLQKVAVTGVTLDKDTYSIQEDATGNLVATVTPQNATVKDVTWTSSNSNVAEVSSKGVITGIKEGTATITVTTVDGGFTDTCEVTVTKKIDDSDDIYIPDDEPKDEEQDDPIVDNTIEENTVGDDIQIEDDENKNITQIPAEDEDLTTSDKILPDTGISAIIILIVAISTISVIIYVKTKQYKDI